MASQATEFPDTRSPYAGELADAMRKFRGNTDQLLMILTMPPRELPDYARIYCGIAPEPGEDGERFRARCLVAYEPAGDEEE
jgi:hypothetical protein